MLEGTVGRRRCSQPWEAGAGGADGVVWFGRLEEEEDKRLKIHDRCWMSMRLVGRIVCRLAS